MKKFVFSAVVMMAFTAHSFSNSILVDEIEYSKIECEIVETNNQVPPSWAKVLIECVGVYNEIKTTYSPVVGQAQAESIAYGAFVGCMGGL